MNARNENGWTALHAAAEKGNVSAMDMLLTNDADINVKSDTGETCLHVAARLV